MISKICLFSILILICYIFSTNKVLEIRLVILIPLSTKQNLNQQLCLKLTDPNFAWFNSHSTKKVPTLGLASSYLRTSVLSVFYDSMSLPHSPQSYMFCLIQYFVAIVGVYLGIFSQGGVLTKSPNHYPTAHNPTCFA